MAGNNEAPDPEAAEAALIDRVADGSVIRRPLGDDALWLPGPAGAERKRSGSNGARSSAGRSPHSAVASSSPLIGPSPTPAPSWPVATHRPGTAREGPRAGSPSGSHGRRPGPRVGPREPRDRGHQLRRALEHRVGDRGVDAGVEAAALAARADEHVALPRRLDHGRDLQPGVGRRDGGEVGAVEDLVADDHRAAQPDELALARLERQLEPRAACELGAPGPGGEHDRVRPQRAARQADPFTRQDPLDARVRVHPYTRLLGHGAGDRARVALQVVGEVGGAEEVRGEARLERARLLGLEQLAAHARRGEPLEPRGLGGEPGGLAMHDERALAADAGALAVAALDRRRTRRGRARRGRARARRACPSTARCPRRARSCRPRPRRRRSARPRRRAPPARAPSRRRRSRRRRPRPASATARSRPGRGRSGRAGTGPCR